MDKEQLHKFFFNQASVYEIEQIMRWVEDSPENQEIFMLERQLFDSMIIRDCRSSESVNRKSVFATPNKKIKLLSSISAVASLLIMIGAGLYFFIYEKTEEPIAMQTVIVPAGQYVNLILSDSTKVRLGSGSTIQYPASFGKNERKVILNGEALFEVTKDNVNKFIVETSTAKIEVFGTTFNVVGFDDESSNFSTTLIDGSVNLSSKLNPSVSIKIKPNQTARVKHDGLITTEYIDDGKLDDIRNGMISFKNASLAEILSEFEKQFKVQIIIESKNRNRNSYTGRFRIADGLDYSLRVLRKNIRFNYQWIDEENTILKIKY